MVNFPVGRGAAHADQLTGEAWRACAVETLLILANDDILYVVESKPNPYLRLSSFYAYPRQISSLGYHLHANVHRIHLI
jgi:hypothetical protein